MGAAQLVIEDEYGDEIILYPNFNTGTSSHSDTCYSDLWGNSSGQERFYQAPEIAWWACTHGLTKCPLPDAFQTK